MKKILLIIALFTSLTSIAQTGVIMNRYYISGSLAIGKNDRTFSDSSAWIDIGKDTTNKGLILPKVVLDSIHTNKRALFVYDLKDSVLFHFDGNKRTRYMSYKDTNLIKSLIATHGYKPDSVTWATRYFASTPSNINQSASYRLVTDTEKATWNRKHSMGGDNTTVPDSFGTKTNQPISFITNNAIRGGIATNGTWTIGNSSVAQEYVMSLDNDQSTGKIQFYIGRGGGYSTNAAGIQFGEYGVSGGIGYLANVLTLSSNILSIQNVTYTGSPIIMGGHASSNTGTILPITHTQYITGYSFNPTSGSTGVIDFVNNGNVNYTPSSGNNYFFGYRFSPTIVASGTYAGSIEGFVFNPTVNSIASGSITAFRAGNNTGRGFVQEGANATNQFNGNTGIGIAPDVSYKLRVGNNTKIDGTITTNQPSANGAGAWKLGKKVDASVTLVTDKYIEVEIDGAAYKLALAQ
jgi:hypothetical protein